MECIHCSRPGKTAGSLAAHQQACPQNPNRQAPRRGIGAGRQPGSTSLTKGLKVGRASHWDDKFPLSVVLVEDSSYPRHCLKKRILDNNLIPYVCKICGQEPVWCGKPMPLILDHVNGVNNDNRLENLRFVCSHCDTQLPTYKSKNR